MAQQTPVPTTESSPGHPQVSTAQQAVEEQLIRTVLRSFEDC